MMSGGSRSGCVVWSVAHETPGLRPQRHARFVHVGPAGYLPGAGNLGRNHNPVSGCRPIGKQIQLPHSR